MKPGIGLAIPPSAEADLVLPFHTLTNLTGGGNRAPRGRADQSLLDVPDQAAGELPLPPRLLPTSRS